MEQTYRAPFLLITETEQLCHWARNIREKETPFNAARMISRKLGAHVHDGYATFGFWLPETHERGIHHKCIFLEILDADARLDLQLPIQEVAFKRHLLQLAKDGDFFWAAVSGLRSGSRDEFGVFYRVTYQDNEGRWLTRLDYLPWSLPFGAFGPAELYDRAQLNQNRKDLAYFRNLPTDNDGVAWIGPSTNLLEIHPNTSCAEGSLAGLTRIFSGMANKIRRKEPLTPFEKCFAGYDGIQLMPIEPTVAFETGPPFFELHAGENMENTVTGTLRKPTATNWGYDVVISGMSAVAAKMLETSRPDELVDLIETLHNFPGKPIKVVFDLVYGHADSQALDLLNRHFFVGPNMYGHNIDYRHPVVRAILLEMAERKIGFGADGLRVDGAQDFNYWNEEKRRLVYDDEFLLSMGHQIINMESVRYRPWTIFEDGRPWPREDYELASSYRALIEQDNRAFQWGPLTFAHNTPFACTFWISKWWRLEEIAFLGNNWISGVANHDTLRRGAQADPESIAINQRLGNTLPDILKNAYNQIGVNLLMHAFLPGVPLDFINANVRAPWGFIRNTDYRYAVKVMGEEWRSVFWQMDEDNYRRADFFIQLKALGFNTLEDLSYFMHNLVRAMLATMYDVTKAALFINSLSPPVAGPTPINTKALQDIARAWMDDMHAYSNISRHTENLDPFQTSIHHAIRCFRQKYAWLQDRLSPSDLFFFNRPINGTVLICGLRHSPDQSTRIMIVVNMEGETIDVDLHKLFPAMGQGWIKVLPEAGEMETHLTLANSEGFVAVSRA